MATDGARVWARDWLFDHALPLWWRDGADHRHGGWHDRIAQDGTVIIGPQRARVQARQVFVYAEAGRMGWQGDWPAAVRHGIHRLRSAFLQPDGLYRQRVVGDGAPGNGAGDDSAALYDQAFVLLALASGYRALGERSWLDAAFDLVAILETRLRHPYLGYREIDATDGMLKSNPHMHLLEALLAWVEAGVTEPFATAAQRIVTLAETRLIAAETGAIGEYFDDEWRPAAGLAGQIREPGHQFEWSYLLTVADRVLGGDRSITAGRLYDFGMRHGVDADRGVAIFSCDGTGKPVDASARLWAQTEWLRAAVTHGDAAAVQRALTAVQRYLDVPIAGLWRDRLDVQGRFVDEGAPASSLYHITTALQTLLSHCPTDNQIG